MKYEHCQMMEKCNFSQETITALLSERLYQEHLWNADTTASAGLHSDIEFLVFIEDYLREAFTIVSRNPEPMASETALQNIRKIGAMVCASAEKNDWMDDLLINIQRLLAEMTEDEINFSYGQSVVECLAAIRCCTIQGFLEINDVKPQLMRIFYVCAQAMSKFGAFPREFDESLNETMQAEIERILKGH